MTTAGDLPVHLAAILCLSAAMLWGSWMTSLKYIGDYPVAGFILTVYISSFALVWGVAIVVERQGLFHDLRRAITNDPVRVLGILLGGAAFAIGMGVTLGVLGRLGLSIAQPIQSSISIALGTAVTIGVGGLPDGVALGRVILAVCFLVCAVFATMLAAWYRAQAWTNREIPIVGGSMGAIWRTIPLMLLASLLSTAYPWALSIGLQSPTQQNGLEILPYMAMLVTGSLIGSLAFNGISLSRQGQWRTVLATPFRLRRWALGSGVFHFGGNIIHGIGAVSLSASLAYPLGLTATFWTLLWGLVHGEFRDASRKAIASLMAAMVLYCVGVAIIVSTL